MLPLHSKCSGFLRPNIVFFEEDAPKYVNMYNTFYDCEVLVVIGTSGAVVNTDRLLTSKVKISILNNLEPSIFILKSFI
jgi:NAD-dependent deacetylase